MFFLVIFLAVTVNFLIPRLMPGDPVEQKLNTLMATGGGQMGDVTAMADAYRERFGLNQPLWKQYINYWWDILHFDFGYSLANYPQKVARVITSAMPWTVGLLGFSTLVAFAVGTMLGALLAWPESPRWLRSLVPVLMTLSSIPYFLLGIILVYFFAIRWRILPAAGAYSFGRVLRFDLPTILDIAKHAILPASAIIISGIGVWALEMRGMMIGILGEDFISFARVKGLKEQRIFRWYGIRNGMLPQATALAVRLGYIVAGAILVEVIFSYPGIGYKLYQAVQAKDYFVIQGIVLVLIFAIAFVMLVMDLIYPALIHASTTIRGNANAWPRRSHSLPEQTACRRSLSCQRNAAAAGCLYLCLHCPALSGFHVVQRGRFCAEADAIRRTLAGHRHARARYLHHACFGHAADAFHRHRCRGNRRKCRRCSGACLGLSGRLDRHGYTRHDRCLHDNPRDCDSGGGGHQRALHDRDRHGDHHRLTCVALARAVQFARKRSHCASAAMFRWPNSTAWANLR